MAWFRRIHSVVEIKKAHLGIASVIFVVEVMIALWVRDSFVRPYVGDFLVTILLYCIFRGVFAGSGVLWAGVAVGFCFFVETLQAFQIVERLGLSDSTFAKTIIGTSFSMEDLFAYFIGGVTALLVDKFISN